MKTIGFFLLIAAFIAVGFLRASSSATRDEFIEAARNEREVVLSTTINLEEAGSMARHFKAKYPFLEVNINPGGRRKDRYPKSCKKRARRKSIVDVIQTPAFYLHALRKRGIIGEYTPADDRFYPRNFKEEKVLDNDLLQSLRRSLQHQADRGSKSSEALR